jgi:transposase
MGHRHGEDFKCEAVRLALSSGLSRKRVADDLGVGLSMLGKWIAAYKTKERGDVPSADLLKEVEQLCRVLQVISRGYRAWRSHPMGPHQRKDLVILAHIREQHDLALGSYGRPRMTEELKELGLGVGHRRVGRLMRENNIRVVCMRKHMATTDSNHRFNISPNLLDRDFSASGPNQKWADDISYIWTREGWLYLERRAVNLTHNLQP